jgi:UDP-N-acetylmuramate dehydrogenase
MDDLRAAFEIDPRLVVLGDGANLLVDDDGIDRLVVVLDTPEFQSSSEPAEQPDGSVLIRVGAGLSLPRLINQTVAAGLSGLEGLAGFPASIGGAVRMNAGGAFGEIASAVQCVHAVDTSGMCVVLQREQINFGYRHSGLDNMVITHADLRLRPSPQQALRQRRDEVMQHKKASQPLGAKSAGCCFKNPTLTTDLDAIGATGQRVSAGMLIDKAGAKGMSVGGATVSDHHANFITTHSSAKARDVIELMVQLEQLVAERFGITLEREVVVWQREHGS